MYSYHLPVSVFLVTWICYVILLGKEAFYLAKRYYCLYIKFSKLLYASIL